LGLENSRRIGYTFCVCCAVVRRALGWLKAFNPKYYGHIKIDDGRIQALPEDDVPLAITSVIQQSTDTGIINQESDGYVPWHEDPEVEVGELTLTLHLVDIYFKFL
jgi:hypothetical protein